MKRHVAEVALSVLILLLAGWCEAGKKKSKKDQAEAGKAGHGRVAIPVTDTAVQSATEVGSPCCKDSNTQTDPHVQPVSRR